MHDRPPVSLEPATAQQILAPIVPDFTVTDVVARTGGQLSTVYEVRSAGSTRPVVVKVYADQWRWKLAKEVHVYQQMGHLLAVMHDIGQDAYGYLTTHILDPQPTNTAYMRRQFTKKLCEYAEHGGDPALTAAMNRHVAQHAHLFAACKAPVLCHNDFHEGNVLVAPTGDRWQVTGYVDVENAVAADPLFDLAKTDFYAIRGDQTKRRAFIRGYGPLPTDAPRPATPTPTVHHRSIYYRQPLTVHRKR